MMQSSLAIPKGLAKIGAYLSLSKLPNILAGLIIFFSATQLGLHFWPLSSLVYGIRVDYLSPTLYLFDLLLLSYLIVRRSDLLPRTLLKRNSRLQVEKGPAAAGRRVLMGTLTPTLLVNLLYSQNPLATLSWSLHFLLYFVFLRRLLNRRPEQSSRRDIEGGRSLLMGTLRLVLPLSLLFQLLLALAQVFLGHSVGGLLYYVGERNIAVGAPSIALGSFMGEVVLRAYGTFGHPNVLAGWAVIVLLILIRLRESSSRARLPWFPAIFAVFLVFLTQSRAAALSLFGLVIPFYFLKTLKSRVLYFSLGLLFFWFVSLSFVSPARSDLSLTERLDLQGVSLKIIQAFPIFGTGAQASINVYPHVSPQTRLLQPDHNSFTLFLSWFGIFGVLAVLYTVRRDLSPRIYLLSPLLPLLLFDHYLLTSPQGLFVGLFYLYLFNLRG